ncbi:hypothetical protein SLE2022_308180 [Rubroshorea leprosula]
MFFLQLADDQTLNVKIERHGAKAFAQDPTAGGTESSLTTVEWAMAELLKRLDLQKGNRVTRQCNRERQMGRREGYGQPPLRKFHNQRNHETPPCCSYAGRSHGPRGLSNCRL